MVSVLGKRPCAIFCLHLLFQIVWLSAGWVEFVCGVSVGEKAMCHFLSSFVIPDSLALSWLSGVCVWCLCREKGHEPFSEINILIFCYKHYKYTCFVYVSKHTPVLCFLTAQNKEVFYYIVSVFVFYLCMSVCGGGGGGV